MDEDGHLISFPILLVGGARLACARELCFVCAFVARVRVFAHTSEYSNECVFIRSLFKHLYATNWQGMLYNKIRGEISDDELRVGTSVNMIVRKHAATDETYSLGGVPCI